MQHLTLVFGIALTMAGVGSLFAAWRARRAGQRRQRNVRVVAGWLLLCLSFVPWIVHGGNDRGVALAIMAFMLAGSTLVLLLGARHRANGRRRNGERDANGASDTRAGGWRLLVRRVWVFLLAGPVSFAVAMLATAALYLGWTGSAPDRLAAVMLAVPFAWTLLAIYATYDISLRQRSVAVLGLAAVSAAVLFVLLPETL